MPNICPFCQKEAEVSSCTGGRDCFNVTCRTCGRYEITGTDYSTDQRKYGELHILSGIIRNQYEEGIKVSLNTRTLENIKDTVTIPKDPFEIIDKLLIYIFKKAKKIHIPIKIDINYDYPILFLENGEEMNYYITKAQELKYIEQPVRHAGYILSLKGWERIAEIKSKIGKSNQAFVAMWFDSSLDSIWENGFKRALIETGFNPIRIDLQEHNEKICDKIISEIRNSSLVIADFTGPGVVYILNPVLL